MIFAFMTQFYVNLLWVNAHLSKCLHRNKKKALVEVFSIIVKFKIREGSFPSLTANVCEGVISAE